MHHSALSRIERGKRPYDQDFIERLAEELLCEPVDLLIRNPLSPSSIWSIWERIEPPQRDTALRILEQLAEKKPVDKKVS